MTDASDTRTLRYAGHFPNLSPTPAPLGASGYVRTIVVGPEGRIRLIDTRGMPDGDLDAANKVRVRAGMRRHWRGWEP